MAFGGIGWFKGSSKAPIHFIADRTDGFGSRILTLMNAIVAAKCYSGRVALQWPDLPPHLSHDFHSVLTASETFSPTYLDKVGLSAADRDQMTTIEASDVEVGENAELLLDDSVDAIVMNTWDIGIEFQGFFRRFPRTLYGEAFYSIEFSEPLRHAQELALGVKMENPFVALHLRTGDIVFGPTRRAGTFVNKIVPFQIAQAAVRKFVAEGKSVLVFGEDENICRWLAEIDDVHYVADLPQYVGFSEAQKVMFEICLMSRCTAILQGHSAFAIAPSWIGNIPLLKVAQVMEPRQAIDVTMQLIDAPPANMHDLQIAYAIYFTLFTFRDDMTDDEIEQCIEQCLVYDRENPFHRTMKAHNFYRTDRASEAEAYILAQLQSEELSRGFKWLWANNHGLNMIQKFESEFEEAAKAGYPLAALCLAYRRQIGGQIEAAKEFAFLYFENRDELRTNLDSELETLL